MSRRQRRGVFYLALGCACVLLGTVMQGSSGLVLTVAGFGFVVIA